jgi:ribulose kinase
MAYVYANSLSSAVPRALDSLTRAQAIFESFSLTCPTALSPKETVQSLANSVQNIVAHSSCAAANVDPIGWDLFASLLEEQQTSPAGLESSTWSNDLYDSIFFSPLMPSASQINTPGFNPAATQFSDS